ncbi:hypothetical protein GL325_08810 [Aeromicrobium sp. 636]|uniref:Uncharacterized protein n=1 Tax=Aeromicrobium senzhongii TaxID=2663859 RepID=A0A8I0K2W7_9ACTN|nr:MULTISPECIES: hypothetical protein [Aeromicrobium]MBC9226420.1 hypothetical protein [Aeromicrobium senzhongii]MCQ3998525.1 hypothetical protein [Aeromicrobium sp. 636]
MTRDQITLCGLGAATISGGVSALGCLVIAYALEVAGGSPFEWHVLGALVVVWAVFGLWLGVFVGIFAGVLPTILSVVLWPRLVARGGIRRALDMVVALVTAVAWVEALVLVGLFDARPVEAFWWASGAAMVSGASMWIVLRLSCRAHLRRTALHAATY